MVPGRQQAAGHLPEGGPAFRRLPGGGVRPRRGGGPVLSEKLFKGPRPAFSCEQKS